MTLALVDFSGRPIAALPAGSRIVVGRAAECEVTLTDPTISRRHAELRGDDDVLTVRDLGSRNGTFRNGQRIDAAQLRAGDAVTFGGLTLRVAAAPPPALAPAAVAPAAVAPAPAAPSIAAAPPSALPPAPSSDDAAQWYAAAAQEQSLRAEGAAVGAAPPAPALEADEPAPDAPAPHRSIEEAPNAVADAEPSPVEQQPTPDDEPLSIVAELGDATPGHEMAARKLALLLDVAKRLGTATDPAVLLERVVSSAFETLEADRAVILLAEADGTLRPAVARDRWGADLVANEAARAVPRSIANAAIERRAALLSMNAAVDPRFGGQSIMQQRVRSAMCAPLLGSEAVPLGVLYVDSGAPGHSFEPADLDFLAAFAGITAAALETARLAERLRREAVARGNFERYFAPNVAARIAQSNEVVRPGGERRHVTVLFGDLRGFTRFAAGASPDAVAATVSEFLSAMVDCVFRHGGTLDKFIGDAVMAQWGAPEGDANDADRAMCAALDMLDALDTLNLRWQREGRESLAMGIGMAYGEVFAGNIGSERRLEFTVLGDAVNLASRLCDAAGPNVILVGDSLRSALHAPPPMRAGTEPVADAGDAPIWVVARRTS